MEKLTCLTILFLAMLAKSDGQNVPEACSRLFKRIELNDASNYNPDEPPPVIGDDGNSSSVILVKSDHRVVDVTEVNDVKRTVSLQLVSHKVWKDRRVKV